jgi:hypothetical protein
MLITRTTKKVKTVQKRSSRVKNPAEAVEFFCHKNPKHAFLWRGSKAVCPILQICGKLKNPTITVEVAIEVAIEG